MLVGKYIPNLIAKPFDVSREYAQIIYDQTSSPKLDKVLKKWEQEKWGSAENRQKLAYIILVELLAYQFASPVRWIQTQDLLFTTFNFERLVELGPSPTLTGMATRTLKTKYETLDGSVSRNRSILCHAKNVKEIYYQYEDEIEAPASDVTVDVPVATTLVTPVTTSTAVSTPSSGPVASIEDAPIKAIDILLVIVAQKLKKRVDEIPFSKSIKDLVGGKSTLQNDILGDLQQEFASAPEKGEELSLEELGTALGSGFSGALGKYSTSLISRLVGGKMPGGFNSSAIKSYLGKSWGLGSSRSDGVLLLGTTLEPPKRLASEAEGKSWLDGVVSVYAQRSGISLASSGAGGASGGGGGGAVKNFLSSEVINRSLLLSMLNSTCVTSHATHGQERLPSIRKKLPVWRCKPSSTVSTVSMAMLILREYNLALTSSRLAISTHPGIGFVKTLCLCTMISFLVGSPLLIEKSPRIALPSLTGPTLTCSCSTISISVMLRRERPTD
jgi:fatty acid synthase subunit alpha